LEPYDNPFWKNSDGGRKRKEEEKRGEQAGAELCQAQNQLG
jgi:hypothetical protein